MEKCCACQPGHEARVLYWIPAPVAAPTEDGVCPVHAEKDSAGEEEPCDHCPGPRNLDPLFAWIAHHQSAEGKCEGDGESDIAEIKHRRMDDHLGVLEEGVEAISVVGNRALHQRKWR